MDNYTYLSSNKSTKIEYTIWEPACEPKGIVQIVHGMSEHLGRYNRFAEYLVANGYAVCANNHLGHGGSLINDTKGYFGEEGSYRHLIEDTKLLTMLIKERHPDKRLFILGHSMGSFIVRLYITRYGHLVDGVILSGTSGPNPEAEYGAYYYAKTLRKLKGSDYVSKKLDNMVIGSFSKRNENDKNSSEWLSTDEERVNAYTRDPLCGFPFTVGGYCEMFTMMRLVSHRGWADLITRQLPILLVSGDQDPVGQYGAGVITVRDRLVEAGQRDVWLNLYHNGRHEMLNEKNSQQVYDDILYWLTNHNPQTHIDI